MPVHWFLHTHISVDSGQHTSEETFQAIRFQTCQWMGEWTLNSVFCCFFFLSHCALLIYQESRKCIPSAFLTHSHQVCSNEPFPIHPSGTRYSCAVCAGFCGRAWWVCFLNIYTHSSIHHPQFKLPKSWLSFMAVTCPKALDVSPAALQSLFFSESYLCSLFYESMQLQYNPLQITWSI